MTLSLGLISLLVTLVVLLAACTVVVIAAPWSRGPGELRDHVRIGRAVTAFDFWLELSGVRGRRRRDLRDELRANLYEASATRGSAEAVAALGPLRVLARAYAERAPRGKDWSRGVVWCQIVTAVVLVVSLLTTLTWLDAALASDAESVSGRPFVAPWLTYTVEVTSTNGTSGARAGDATSFAMSTGIDWWILVVPLVAFAVGARPWRRAGRGTLVG